MRIWRIYKALKLGCWNWQALNHTKHCSRFPLTCPPKRNIDKPFDISVVTSIRCILPRATLRSSSIKVSYQGNMVRRICNCLACDLSSSKSQEKFHLDFFHWNVDMHYHRVQHDTHVLMRKNDAGTLSVPTEGISFSSRRSVFMAKPQSSPTSSADPDKSDDAEIIDSGMILPFEQLSLTFSDVSYYVPLPKVTLPLTSCLDTLMTWTSFLIIPSFWQASAGFCMIIWQMYPHKANMKAYWYAWKHGSQMMFCSGAHCIFTANIHLTCLKSHL